MDDVMRVLLRVLISLVVGVLLYAYEPIECSRPYNKNVKITSTIAPNDHLVTNLPGQPRVNFRHYAGFVTVNEEKGRALFYWFYEASTQPLDKPLVLWLNGGPGCSSVGYGATQEIGPFLVNNNGNGLKFNPYAWNREANILFLESPVGVGFSYTNSSTDFDNLGDDFTANDAYEFLNKWFLKFPTYRNHAFYIAGESYAGKYVPELAEVIHDRNNITSSYIDLKGILMGNPETSDPEDWNGLVDYAWSHAIISDETHRVIREYCDFKSDQTWSNPECTDGVKEVLRQYKEIDIYSLYTSVCIANSTNNSGSSMEVMFQSTSKMNCQTSFGYSSVAVNCFIMECVGFSFTLTKWGSGQNIYQKELEIHPHYLVLDWTKTAELLNNCVETADSPLAKSADLMPRIMGGYDPCLDDYANAYYNRPDVQMALHVSNGHELKNWSICNSTLFNNWADSKSSVLPIYEKLIAAGLRIWVYSGDTDGRVPVLSTRYSLNALGLPITKPWTPWYHEQQVSGWYQEYKGLTFATFRGAGHAVPIFKPSSALALFTYFLQSASLPSAR